MIRARIFRDAQGRTAGFEVTGHAGDGEPGRDLVCAAVSAVTQTALIGLESWCSLPVEARVAKGYLWVWLPPESRGAAEPRAVLETMVMGLKAIGQEHADRLRLAESVLDDEREIAPE